MTNYRQFTAADWQRIERDWSAWWNGELDRPLVVLEVHQPHPTIDWHMFDTFVTQFALDVPVDQVLDYFQQLLDALHYFGDAYPKWWVNCGAGIMAAFLGASVEHQNRTTWFHEIGVSSLDDIKPMFDASNVWWQRVYEITRSAVKRWGVDVTIGMTDLGGNLDILASLRGTQQLLLDLYDMPDEVERLCEQITGMWWRYYETLHALTQSAGRGSACWGPCWSPTSTYMLQSDFAYMISPDMFERFVLPDLTALCDKLDHAFYHMDGIGQIRHLDALLAIPNLRGIQWQPGDGQPTADNWLDLLRRIRDGDKLCQVYVNRAGAYRILREAGGRGFVFHVLEILEPEPLTLADAEAFVEDFQAEAARIG